VRDAAQIMRDHGIGNVLVVEDGSLADLITDRDIVVRAIAEGRDPATTSAGGICNRDLVTLRSDMARLSQQPGHLRLDPDFSGPRCCGPRRCDPRC
jgi:hypothetical protein